MPSQYIPQDRRPAKPSIWYRIKYCLFGSFYIGKLKVTFDAVGGPFYKFGMQFTVQYRQLEFNFGKLVLNLWYRE